MREKYESNKAAMVILGKSLPEIQAAIPAAGAHAAAVSGSQVEKEGGRKVEGGEETLVEVERE